MQQWVLTQNNWLMITTLLILLCLVLFWAWLSKGKEIKAILDDVKKNTLEFNRLVEKYDALLNIKGIADQKLAKCESTIDGLNIRLSERDQYIQQQQATISNKEHSYHALQNEFNDLNQQLTQIKTTLSEKEKSFLAQQQALLQTKNQLSLEFKELANQILEEKSQVFNQSSQLSLNSLLKPFREQVVNFQNRVNQIHSETIKGNTSIEAEIKKVLDIGITMSQEANNLTHALKGEKKTAGNWGEVQLERSLQLAGLIADEHYTSQAMLKNNEGKTNYPDFVVKLPDNKHLIIDSKVSLVAYENATSEVDEDKIQLFLQQHIKAIKNHISDLSRKDYANLIGIHSPDFVLLFIPIEPAYIEALKHDRELYNYGYDKNIILVSHTTLMPILRTVANLWRIERGNIEAKEISARAGEVYNQVCVIADRLHNIGKSLSAVNNHYNSTVKALIGQQGLAGKVERFKTLSTKANKIMPDVDELYVDMDTEKLLSITKAED